MKNRRKKAVTGLTSELKAQLRLAEDPNLIVFAPVGGLGPVDIVTLNMTTGEYNTMMLNLRTIEKLKIMLQKMGIKETLKDLLYVEVQLKNKRNLM